MDRRTFLTTILQGSLAAALLPNSISSLLVTQYGQPEICQQKMSISAIGVGSFGTYCTRLLAYSVPHISCHELRIDYQQHNIPDFSGLVNAIQHSDLLFMLADTAQPLCSSVLSACVDAAAEAGVQVVIIGPNFPAYLQYSVCKPNSSPSCYCAADPIIARNLIAMVSDLVNTTTFFAGVDFANVRASLHSILRSGSNGIFIIGEASGANKGVLASKKVLTQLEQQVTSSNSYRGAMACIYCNSETYLNDFDQAIIELFRFFIPPPTNGFNIIYNCVIDNSLLDAARVAVLAIV
ncbi:hypothetical protein FY034_00040 [Trichlorobacter lovleyi]|uniref:hypothetical protein n=1 Tax=Trichlorobacter lovleyi TaxID=313985 RepID=UPI00223F4B5A|nr:hypothetical protein [Trichlorobacter lovleyi]QOX77397.1 hypothetical protein FY034_00040 [Trichlorobacter lovleyi]